METKSVFGAPEMTQVVPQVRLVTADIFTFYISGYDWIVNPANRSLSHGGRFALALKKRWPDKIVQTPKKDKIPDLGTISEWVTGETRVVHVCFSQKSQNEEPTDYMSRVWGAALKQRAGAVLTPILGVRIYDYTLEESMPGFFTSLERERDGCWSDSHRTNRKGGSCNIRMFDRHGCGSRLVTQKCHGTRAATCS